MKKENKNKTKKTKNPLMKKSKVSICLYILAILSLGYTSYAIYDTHNYVNQLVSYGSIDLSTQMSEVISYYVSTSAPFLFYSIVFASIGYLTNKVNVIYKHLIPVNTELATVENKDEAKVEETNTEVKESNTEEK